MNVHQVVRLVIAVVVGILLALMSYERITDPGPALQRAREEAVVLEARRLLGPIVAPGEQLQVVDPLNTDRSVGKAYVYPADDGWEVSGHYRRPGEDRWHPFLMALDAERRLVSLEVRDDDPRLVAAAAANPQLTVSAYPRSDDKPDDQAEN